MSTVRRASAAYLGSLAAIRAVQPEHDVWFRALADGVTSAVLAELHHSIDADLTRNAAVDLHADLHAAFAAVARVVPQEVLPLPPLPLAEVSSAELSRLGADLLGAVDGVRKELAAHEQRATAEAVGMALRDLGYAVERAQFDGVVTGFEASTADAKLLVQVTGGGGVVTDFVGLSDGASCASAHTDMVERVGHYGILLTECDREDHSDARGGSLARRAAHAEGCTLAERIVAAHQAGARHAAPRTRVARQVTA